MVENMDMATDTVMEILIKTTKNSQGYFFKTTTFSFL